MEKTTMQTLMFKNQYVPPLTQTFRLKEACNFCASGEPTSEVFVEEDYSDLW